MVISSEGFEILIVGLLKISLEGAKGLKSPLQLSNQHSALQFEVQRYMKKSTASCNKSHSVIRPLSEFVWPEFICKCIEFCSQDQAAKQRVQYTQWARTELQLWDVLVWPPQWGWAEGYNAFWWSPKEVAQKASLWAPSHGRDPSQQEMPDHKLTCPWEIYSQPHFLILQALK